jgi:phage terminase large subunit GpA-like protein
MAYASTPEGRKSLNRAMQRAAALYAPPPILTVSQWADRYRKLSPEASAEHGQWITSRAEYQRGFMDAINDPAIETVVAMWSAQSGKTEAINNMIGYYIDQDPSPMLIVQPTEQMAEAWSKDRLAPMLRDTPCLRGKVKDPRSRDSGNTLLHKQFPGGHITAIGANAPASLAGRPIRIVFGDEVDRYPASAGEEGDPVSLARVRARNFWNRKFIWTSTPTIRGASRIERLYESSDQRHYHVPCPHCHAMQILMWAQIIWPTNQPELAVYACSGCGAEITDADKPEMLRRGTWVAEKPGGKIAGFHLNGLYSPWVTFAEMATDFVEAKRSRSVEQLKTFINTSLAETWEDESITVDDGSLFSRREEYKAIVPEGGLVITAAVDVQDDRLEAEVIAWGIGEESWSIDVRPFRGNPAQPQVWRELDAYLQQTFEHESGVQLRIACTMIDSGGHHTKQVYGFCRARQQRRIYACKGVAGPGKPLAGRPSKGNVIGAFLFPVGVDTAKEILYARLKLTEFGPGYCHFPKLEQYDEEYFKQLTAEKQKTKYRNGFPTKFWEKVRARNEALDLRVYAMAALDALKPNFQQIAAMLEREAEKIEHPPQVEAEKPKPGPPQNVLPPQVRRPAIPRQGWVNSWKW